MGAATQGQAHTLKTLPFQLQGSKVLLGCLSGEQGSGPALGLRILSLPVIVAEF
jgi:hypothetical protein